MNLDVYQKLRQNIKDVIQKMRADWPRIFTEEIMNVEKVAFQKGKELGVKFYIFTPEEKAAWRERARITELVATLRAIIL